MRVGCGVLAFAIGTAAAVATVASGQTPASPQPQPPQTCHLVRDANGNLVLDPACPTVPAPSPVPANPAATAPAAPAASAAQRFPFPGESSAPVAPGSQVPQNIAPNPGSGAGDANAPASKRFPFPGEPGANGATVPSSAQPGAPAGGQPPLRDAGSSGESSSSSSGSSSSSSSNSNSDAVKGSGSQAADPDSTDPDDPAADPAKIEAARRARRRKAEPPPSSPSEREQEDVQVAGFYQNDGDFKGAYSRAKDAVALDNDDPAAHLALAESARRLGKLDEAEQEYKQTLALDPVPKQRKIAEKALKEMAGGG